MKKAIYFLSYLSFAISILLWSCSSDRNTFSPDDLTPPKKPITLTPPIVVKVAGEEGFSFAFTDLVFFDNQFFVTFRKADKHDFGQNGVIQLYSSTDGQKWSFIKEYAVKGIDLRDPKFSVNENNLFLYIHGSTYVKGRLVKFSDFTTLYKEGVGFQDLQNVYLDNTKIGLTTLEGNEAWPWRVTWYKGKAYTVGYYLDGIFDLYSSDDGISFKNINSFADIGGRPNEATIRVDQRGEFFIIARRLNGTTIVGRTFDPYRKWDWSNEIEFLNFGGPNFVFTKKNKMIVSGRLEGYVSLTNFDLTTRKISLLTSTNTKMDCGYPGMVVKGDYLWLSYYSAHENKVGSSIYVLKINLKEQGYN